MASRLNYKPIPFVGTPQQRDLGTSDQRYVNVVFERIPNDVLKEHVVYCIKRPAISSFQSITPTGTSSGRGIYAWGATGKIYSVVNNIIYSGTTSTFSMRTSTGRVWFTETPVDTGNQQLIIQDGESNYNITSTDIVTSFTSSAANYPVSSVGGLVFMDGYLFQGQANGRIVNSLINNTSTWAALNFLTADSHGGALEAIYIQKDQILAFTRNRVEFFYNNGNPSGSPLLRIDQNTIYVGMASRNSLAWSNENACFVGDNPSGGGGGRSIYQIASQKMAPISTPPINRFLDAEGKSISSCTAWMESVGGRMVYCLNLVLSNRSFVYNIETGLWCEWTSAAGGRFNCVSATSLNGATYLQDVSSGQVHVVSTSIYQDNASTFNVILQTSKSSFGSHKRKVETGLGIIGDQTTGSLLAQVSDDDFKSFNTGTNIDMSLQRKDLTRLGSFYERAHRFTYSGTSSFRVTAYIPEVRSA